MLMILLEGQIKLEKLKRKMLIRLLERDEIEKVRKIDRSELIEQLYYYDHGKLNLKDVYIDDPGWTPSEIESHVRHLYKLYDSGGYLYGAFDGEKLTGIATLGKNFIGSAKNQLIVTFFHVDAQFRKQGIGTALINTIITRAKALGAKKLYISATPSKNTINFYFNRGASLTKELNPKLFELEPEDIHLDIDI
ncbi:MAG: GNAT family N-acetyltransferase [Candidatus Hermodarchaeota archaeon]